METGRLDTWADRKKGIVTGRERMKELSIVSNYKLCSVLSWLKAWTWILLGNQDWPLLSEWAGPLSQHQNLCCWKSKGSAGVQAHVNYSGFNFCVLIYVCVSAGWSGVVPVHHQVLLQRSCWGTASLWHHKVTANQIDLCGRVGVTIIVKYWMILQ